ncbi:MAG TPA: PqqD family peptide modification chaperone [Terriglobia bacterium]|jgi:predicted TPR repeat methyltransferase
MIEQAGRLFRNSSLALAPAEDGYWAYDIQTSRLHHLNPVAALILELCDGSRTASEISTELAPFLGESQSDSCDRWIESAVTIGLLSNGTASASSAQLSAADFASAAEELRDDGHVLAAYVCQHHATLLEPDTSGYWKYLGELAHILQKRDDARSAYEQYLKLHGPDAEIEHILVSFRDEAPPARASDSCIRQLYSRFSRFYEDNMVGELEYKVPVYAAAMLEGRYGNQSDLDVLDLGCGTGLSGRAFRHWARHLVGIDLSPEMIEQARGTGIYDSLELAEITAWLKASTQPLFHLIVACDSMIYFGDLRQVFIPASRRLVAGGRMIFGVERSESLPFRLTDSGRYQHSRAHLDEAAHAAGFVVEEVTSQILRYEYGEPVHGYVVLMRLKPQS